MNWQPLAVRLYRRMIKLYPVDFQVEFGEEMVEVLTESISNPGGDDSTWGWRFFLRELQCYPASVLKEHWFGFIKKGLPMKVFPKIIPDRHLLIAPQIEPGSWKSVFLAALPHFLMGLMVAVGLLFSYSLYDEPQSLYMIVAITLACLVMGTLLVAWWVHWPLWSASWYPYGAFVILVVVVLGIERLALEKPWRFTNAFLLVWVVSCFLGYLFIASRSKMHALLSIVMFFPLIGPFSPEFIPNRLEGLTTLSIGILAAVTAGTMVRLNDFKKAFWILVGTNLVVGLWLAYIGEYQQVDFPPEVSAHVPEFSSFLQFLGLYNGISLGVIALPFLLQGIKNRISPKAAS